MTALCAISAGNGRVKRPSALRHWQPPIELFFIREELQHDITPNPKQWSDVERWEPKMLLRTVLLGVNFYR